MADSHSTRGRYRKQPSGARLNTWGLTEGLNGNFDAYDEAIHGCETITVTGAVTLSTANLSTDQARNFGFRFVGSPASATSVTVPSVEGRYAMRNESGVTLTIKTSAGAGAPLRSGTGKGGLFISDGVTVMAVSERTINDLATATGNVSMNGFQVKDAGSPTASSDLVNLGYLNTALASAAIPASTGASLISGTDTTAQYLGSALVAGNRVTLTILNPAADETLQVAVTDTAIGAALANVPTAVGVALASVPTAVAAAVADAPAAVAAAIFSPQTDFEEVIGLMTALSA